MLKKITLSLLACSFLGILLILGTKNSYAQCDGTITCGSRLVEVCTDTSGNSCDKGDPGCINCTYDCQGTTTTTTCGAYSPPAPCEGEGICQVYVGVCIKSGICQPPVSTAVCGNGVVETGEVCDLPGGGCAAGYYCSGCRCYLDSGPLPTDPPPPPSGCTSGYCVKYADYPAMTDCASVAKNNGSGSCTGGICCTDGPGALPPSCEGDAWDVPPRSEGDRGSYVDQTGAASWPIGFSKLVRVKVIYDPPEALVRACLRVVTTSGTDPVLTLTSSHLTSKCQNEYNADGEYHMNVVVNAENIGTARLEPYLSWVETDGGRATCLSHNVNKTVTPGCTLTLDPVSLNLGETLLGFANATNVTSPISQITFTSTNPVIATVTSPGTQVSPTSYFTNVTGVSTGTINYRARAYNSNGTLLCSDPATITVTNTPDWWQTVNGDIITLNGDVESTIPSGFNLIDKVDPISPGAVVYGGNNLDTGAGGVSVPNWSVKGSHNYDQYNFEFFKNNMPPASSVTTIGSSFNIADFNTTGTPDAAGYVWLYYPGGSGPLIISGAGSINRKVVLIAEEGVSIEDNLTLDDNVNDFFMLIALGNINVDPLVGDLVSPSLEGIYYTEAGFSSTDATGTIGTQKLIVQGTVVADSVILGRQLNGVLGLTNPAEQFVYDPNILLNYPKQFSPTRVVWKEVAP